MEGKREQKEVGMEQRTKVGEFPFARDKEEDSPI